MTIAEFWGGKVDIVYLLKTHEYLVAKGGIEVKIY